MTDLQQLLLQVENLHSQIQLVRQTQNADLDQLTSAFRTIRSKHYAEMEALSSQFRAVKIRLRQLQSDAIADSPDLER